MYPVTEQHVPEVEYLAVLHTTTMRSPFFKRCRTLRIFKVAKDFITFFSSGSYHQGVILH